MGMEELFILPLWDVVDGEPVKALWLEKDDRVVVPDGRQQQALCLDGAPGEHDLEPRGVGKVGLRGLAVVVAAMANGPVGRADREPSAVKLVPGPVPVLCSLVCDLIDRRENVVRKLNLGDRASPNSRLHTQARKKKKMSEYFYIFRFAKSKKKKKKKKKNKIYFLV